MTEQTPTGTPPASLSNAEERQWAMFAHLSVWLNLFTVFMGAAIPLIIYFIYKDRSKFVAFHAMQAFVMQVTCSFAGTLFTVVSGAASSAGIVICFPFACIFGILPLAAFVFGTIAGLQVNKGVDYSYWMIGDVVRSRMNG